MTEYSAGARRAVDAMTDFIFTEDAPERSDIIFIPGAMEEGLSLRAAELYREGFAPLLLPSGRYSVTEGRPKPLSPETAARYPGPFETEWEFLSAVLKENGVPEEAILREDRAEYTWQNALFSRRVLDGLGLHPASALLCCKPFHARRALLYYQTAFPDTRIRVCPERAARYTRENWHLSAAGRAKVLGEIARVGGQMGEQLEELFCPPGE